MGFGLRRRLAPPGENIILDGEIVGRLRADVEDLFEVTDVAVPRQAQQGVIVFTGWLLMSDAEEVYNRLAERWARHNYTPLLRKYKGQYQIIGQPGLVRPRPANPWINLALFVATAFSVVFMGAMNDGADPCTQPLKGVPFAFTLLAILGTHEFGHYFAARRHKVAVTLPYFIPMPFNFIGTFGAFIQLRSPVRNRNQLFDVGVAGPLAGLVVALPLLLYGLSISPVKPLPTAADFQSQSIQVCGATLPTEPGYSLEGNSLLYLGAKYLVHRRILPGDGLDVMLHPIAFAAWFGLLVTAFNLLPVGQLDGGHVIFTLVGNKIQIVGSLFVAALLIMGITLWSGWLLWAALIFFLLGVDHPPPLNDVTPLDEKRKLLALLVIATFVLVFTPIPLTTVAL
jgi:membrane-associated protease RseP (regulator of RpoE activity)